ncbi:putative urea ABC transporter substrate-binding protein [Celerinatantimonas sp. YJH-8]|uniref:putative urea ABC transporter substrate-binding protein n=1 Tax=Celerinatantimonas sp. YJH-8 TaxID=3228714 RepID=UPI0038CA91F6
MKKSLLLLLLLIGSCFVVQAAPKPTYKIAWTIYAGTMPLGYAQEHGILKKWGDKYGFDLEAIQLNDYMEAQTQFTAGQLAASVAMTLDALTIPASSGVDTTILMPLSTSAGSDGIIMKGKQSQLSDIKGKTINLVELSGSHYMLDRALASVGLNERDVHLVNTSDSDISAIFADANSDVVVTWKPQLSAILNQFPDASLVYDSSKIYGEIVDGMMIRTELLKQEPNLGKAIIGAWYETMGILQNQHDPRHQEMMSYMAEALNTDLKGLKSQLATIDFFTPAQGIHYVRSNDFKLKMTQIAHFAFAHGLLGETAPNAQYIGIEAGDDQVIGNASNLKLRFPAKWMEQAQ